MTQLPSTAIPAGTTSIEHALCNGTGRVHLPTTSGHARLFVCNGCSACRKPVLVQVDVPAPTAADLAASEAMRRRMRLADVFADLADEEF